MRGGSTSDLPRMWLRRITTGRRSETGSACFPSRQARRDSCMSVPPQAASSSERPLWDAGPKVLSSRAGLPTYATNIVGVPVREGTLCSAPFEDRSFDAVTMWEVILRNTSDIFADCSPRTYLPCVAHVRSTA